MVHSLAAARPSILIMALSYYHLNEFLKKNPQYGATPEQALKAAATGVVTGAIFAGVSGMAQAGNWGRAATMSANSLIGGAMARVQGGDFVTGMGYMFATQAAAWGYESMVGWAADPNPGVTDPNNNVYDPEKCPAGYQRTNVSGINRATGPGGTPTTWEQGGAGSRFLNGTPRGAAVSHLDDLFNNSVPQSLGDSGWFKAVTIPTALLVTVPALMPAPLTVELSVLH